MRSRVPRRLIRIQAVCLCYECLGQGIEWVELKNFLNRHPLLIGIYTWNHGMSVNRGYTVIGIFKIKRFSVTLITFAQPNILINKYSLFSAHKPIKTQTYISRQPFKGGTLIVLLVHCFFYIFMSCCVFLIVYIVVNYTIKIYLYIYCAGVASMLHFLRYVFRLALSPM